MFTCYECGETQGARDRVIREMVEHKISAMDTARELLEVIRAQPAGPLKNELFALHARMVRLQAEEDGDLHNIINGLDRFVAAPAEVQA